MTFYVENETEWEFTFPLEEQATQIVEQVLQYENCPYEVELSLMLTDNKGIRVWNKEYRGMDKETDVLSFPNVDYEEPADFSMVEEEQHEADYFNPETGELILGDMVLSYEKVVSQANEYGHSELREFAFLIVHSMLHLLGYDHMQEDEEKIMLEKQEAVLVMLGIPR